MTIAPLQNFAAIAGGLARAALLLGALAAPVLAFPAFQQDAGVLIGSTIEPTSGAGLVLFVSLQRAR